MTSPPTVGVSRYFAPSLHNNEYAARCESGLMSSAPPEVVLASDHETAIARLAAENKEMRQWWPSARLADLVTERDEARQQLAELRAKYAEAILHADGYKGERDMAQRQITELRELFQRTAAGELLAARQQLAEMRGALQDAWVFIVATGKAPKFATRIEAILDPPLAPTSQPSRGKCACGHAKREDMSRCLNCIECGRNEPDCAQPSWGKCEHDLREYWPGRTVCAKCAQPERQGAK